jgi:D-ribose pyranose/furanose isomerase RbsD
MGACECENPMEFGYEVNSTLKDKEKEKIEKIEAYPEINRENFIKNSKINNDYYNDDIKSIEQKREKEQILEHNIQTSENNNNIIDIENKGVNALKARIEIKTNEQNTESENMNYIFTTTVQRPKDDFSEYIFDNINKIREDPQSFIKVIEQAKKNIILDKKGIFIYKSTVKVALSRGVPAFDETINFLKNLKPMQKLIFSNELLMEYPINEEQIKDKKYMNDQINIKVQNGIPIKSFWRDIIKDPQTCLILMIVDDTGVNSGKKRNDILDPNMQCIGIVSKKIGKSFASYITLC